MGIFDSFRGKKPDQESAEMMPGDLSCQNTTCQRIYGERE
jgi:hypothetical protein